jgi:tRNA (cmo5U34)-methyltransferase
MTARVARIGLAPTEFAHTEFAPRERAPTELAPTTLPDERPSAEANLARSKETGSWTFGAGLARTFDDHVRRSIPGYADLHDQCAALLLPRLRPGDSVFDLGCSTGEFTTRLQAAAPLAHVVGVDGEPEMIEEAKRRHPGGVFACADLTHFEIQPARAIVLLYVLQFLPRETRPLLLRRLRTALGPRGTLILAEKVRSNDPVVQARFDLEYRRFKLAQGFSPAEIEAKSRQLEGVLLPWTEQENEALLSAAGFGSVRPFFRSLCFTAWIAEG